MNLIEWINGKTKLNKTTFDEFQNNIKSAIDEINTVTKTTAKYSSDIFSKVDINAISTKNGVTQVTFRGLTKAKISNNSAIISGLPEILQSTTAIIGISDSEYALGTSTWAYLNGTNILSGDISANKWIHIDVMYFSK